MPVLGPVPDTRRVQDGLAAAHPRLVLSIAHAWQWGLVTVSDPQALEPPRGDGPVSADPHWVVLHVAPARDVAVPDGAPSARPQGAEATVHVEVRDAPHPRTARQVLHDGVLLTPRGVVAIGDAEQEVLVPAHPERTAVRVSVAPGEDLERLTAVWVELGPDPLPAA